MTIYKTIAELPVALSASAADQVEISQSGTSRSITVSQIVIAAGGSNTQTLRAFGAVGDGVTDDTAALVAAFAGQAASPGLKLDGEGLTYATTGLLYMTAQRVWLENLTFKDIAPTNGGTGHHLLRHAGPSASIVIRDVKFNRNGTGTEGSLGALTLSINSCSNLLLEDVEVYGNGAGRGFDIDSCTNVRIVRPYIHDMNWERAVNPGAELIIGIFIAACTSVVVEDHIIRNLTGTVLGVPQVGPAASYRNTDGISVAQSTDVRICNGFTYTVGEGIDVTGSGANNNVRLEDNSYYDCAGYSEKFAHTALDCSTIGARYWRSGIAGLIAGGVANFTALDGTAYDTGAIGGWAATAEVAGFRIDAGDITNTNFWLINCRSYSTTQEYGLRRGGIATAELHVVNFDTTGATISDFDVATSASSITSTGRFSFSGGLDVTTGGVTAQSTTAVGAGAATQAFVKGSSTANLGVYYGTGDPTFSAAKGSLYTKTDATTTTTRLWVNTTGATTWAFLTTSA